MRSCNLKSSEVNSASPRMTTGPLAYQRGCARICPACCFEYESWQEPGKVIKEASYSHQTFQAKSPKYGSAPNIRSYKQTREIASCLPSDGIILVLRVRR